MTSTTVASTSATALAALVSDVATGESAGTVDSGSAQHISQQAEMAISDEAAGNANQAANDLQQAAMTIPQGVQHGSITAPEGATLQRDVTAFATTLGLRAAAATPTTSPATGGNGNGKGKGH